MAQQPGSSPRRSKSERSPATKRPSRKKKSGKKPKPRYRRQRRAGYPDLAFVELNGRRLYLGNWGTPESRSEYRRVIAQWLAGGERLPVAVDELTVLELVERFWAFASEYYRRPDGTPSGEAQNYRRVLKELRQLYGHTSVADFGPLALKALRQQFVDAGNSRGYVNQSVGRIKRVFKWGASEELVSASIFQALQSVSGLRRGRSGARETEPVRPVDESHVAPAIESYVSRQVWALVQLQLLTGARSGEIVGIRAVDLDTTGTVWSYRPASHKTAYRGHARVIYLGPRAQTLLRPWIEERPLNKPLFSAREAERESRERRTRDRSTPIAHGNRPGTNRKDDPERLPGESYTVKSYARAIERACKKAEVPKWHPHQLRHNAATRLRKEHGLDAARIILGHRSAAITEVYAEIDAAKAVEVMERVGVRAR